VKVTIADVAKRAGVSPSTVSRVLNSTQVQMRPETKARVEKAIKELGFTPSLPARALRTGRTNVIALIIPDITNPIWAETADGVQNAAYREGYTIVLCNAGWNGERERNYIELARNSHFDGIIINPVWTKAEDLREQHIPAVLLGVREGFDDFDLVGVDVVSGVLQAIDYFYELGHRRIALVTGPLDTRSGYTRLLGYQQGMAKHGLRPPEAWQRSAPFTQQGGYEMTKALLQLDDPPTAIFLANDIMAVGALGAAKELGVMVPEQLSVIGFDNTTVAAVTTPALTTLTYPKRERGETAIQALVRRIRQEDGEPQRVIFPCRLVERESCAPPPHEKGSK